jgi:hypothetical protein
LTNRPVESINPASSRNLKPPALAGGVFTRRSMTAAIKLAAPADSSTARSMARDCASRIGR